MKKRLLQLVVLFVCGIGLDPSSTFAQTFLNFTINQPAPATASFTFSNVSGSTFAFTGSSSSTNVTWAWDFGDGNSSTDQNPLHTYDSTATYTVCLTVTDENNCTTTECQPIMAVGIEDIPFIRDFSVHPNPFQASARITYNLDEIADVRIELIDALGKQIQVIAQGEQSPGKHQYQLEGSLPSGIYFVSLEVNGRRLTRRIVHNR